MTVIIDWTDERIKLLKKLWAKGLSANKVATKLGFAGERNAVIGKAHRLGLPAHHRPGTPVQQTAPQKRVKLTRFVNHGNRFDATDAVQPPFPPMPLAPSHAITLLELKPHQCRWPFGDGPILFCGGVAVEGKPYCAGYCNVAYRGYWN